MHQYTCPKCKTILKRQEAVPTGKKIKCPKCETVFAPSAAALAKSRDEEDEYASRPYAVAEDTGEEDTVRAEKQRAAMGIVKDRYKKSKRGPAQAKVVQPANWMTAAGVIQGIIWISLFVIGIFPLAFKEFYLDTPKYKKMDAVSLQVEWEAIVVQRIIIMSGAVVGFIFAALICMGAYKMRTLESYGWAMTGAILTTLLGGIWIVVGIWCIITLRDKAVIDGFAEEPPPVV